MLDRSSVFMARDRDPPDASSADRRARLGLAFAGNAEAVRDALSVVRSMDMPPETSGVVEIVLAEILNNIVEHAYAGQGHGMIEMDVDRQDDALAFEIRDRGRPMPGGIAPKGAPHDLDVPAEDLPEGGFGWHLIRSLTIGITYQREGSANVLRFFVPVARRPRLN